MKKNQLFGLEPMSKQQMQEITGGSCSVTCNSGFYSCCNGFTCDCRENGTNASCTSGGAGSSGCSQSPEDH